MVRQRSVRKAEVVADFREVRPRLRLDDAEHLSTNEVVEDLFFLEPRVQREQRPEDRMPSRLCPGEDCRETAEDPERDDSRLRVNRRRRQSHDADGEGVDPLRGAVKARLRGDSDQGVFLDVREERERRMAPSIRHHAIGRHGSDGGAEEDGNVRLRKAMDLGHDDLHRDRVAAFREVEGRPNGHVDLELSVSSLEATRAVRGGVRGRQNQRDSQHSERDEQKPRGTVDPSSSRWIYCDLGT